MCEGLTRNAYGPRQIREPWAVEEDEFPAATGDAEQSGHFRRSCDVTPPASGAKDLAPDPAPAYNFRRSSVPPRERQTGSISMTRAARLKLQVTCFVLVHLPLIAVAAVAWPQGAYTLVGVAFLATLATAICVWANIERALAPSHALPEAGRG